MAYFYYQVGEKETWKVTEDTQSALSEINKQGARRRSILSVNAPITDETDPDKVRYQGPFYIDLDSSDLNEAIASARQLQARLEEEKVPESSYEIYCSGKKGFHFYFHPRLFSNGRAKKDLPYIYKRMAIYFYVPGLDYQVYSGGKGNLFRLPNVQREDGRYKTRITPRVLSKLTEAQYLDLTSSPSNIHYQAMVAPQIENSFMLNAFTSAVEMRRTERKAAKDPGISDANLVQFQGRPPECISDLTESKTRVSTNFNQAAFQLAIYLTRSSTPMSLADSLMSRMAATGSSVSYKTDKEKLSHIRGLYSYAKTNKKRTFSCSAMRSVLHTRPCENCTLHDPKQLAVELYEIEERADGYYAVDSKTERRLTSFVLNPFRMITSYSSESRQESRLYTLCTAETNHEVVGTCSIEEPAWNSRSAFLTSFNGMGNLKVTAGDNDIQNLKHFILRDIEDIDTQEVVMAAGIHRDTRYGKPRYTYVERAGSTNKWGQRNTHLLELPTSSSTCLPDFSQTKMPDIASGKPEIALRALMGLNTEETIAPLIGWVCATHLKSHIMAIGQEFPLLNLWGGRGSGKTKTSTLFSLLSGTDYTGSAPPAFPNTTPFAITATMMSTTTIPRVLDEFNKGGMSQARYSKYAEMLKQAFNGSAAMRGRLSSAGERNRSGLGAVVDSYAMSSPIIYLSEHAPDIAALNDRTFKIMMSERNLAEFRGNMREVVKHKKQILQIAKAMTMKALEIRDEWVEDKMQEWYREMPLEYSERQALTRVVLGVGLEYLELVVCKEMGMPLEQDILRLKDVLSNDVIKNVTRPENLVGHNTEIDYMLSAVAEMYLMTVKGVTNLGVPTTCVKVDGDTLYVDLRSLFPLIKLHLHATNDRLPIPDYHQFKLLLRNESYFISDQIVDPDMLVSGMITTLSMSKMIAKGISAQVFNE